MRWAFLVVGFAAGLAVGILVARDDAATRTSRTTNRPAPGSVKPEAPPAPKPVEPRGQHAPLPSTEPIPEDYREKGYGTIRLDFRGSEHLQRAFLETPGTSGGRPDIDECWIDEERLEVTWDKEPGVYLVWWRASTLDRVGRRVEVREGHVTRLRAADCVALPAMAGMGSLDVYVEAAGGGRRAHAIVRVRRRDGRIVEDYTGTVGACRLELLPGAYEISVGNRRWESVRLEAGKTRRVTLGHADEGDLLILDAPLSVSCFLTQSVLGRGNRWLFLPAGQYDVMARIHLNGDDLRRLGAATVRACQTTEFRVQVPGGEVFITLLPPTGVEGRAPPLLTVTANSAGMVPQRLSGPVARSGDPPRDYYVRRLQFLSTGHYTIRTEGTDWFPAQESVSVAEGLTEIEIPLEPRTK